MANRQCSDKIPVHSLVMTIAVTLMVIAGVLFVGAMFLLDNRKIFWWCIKIATACVVVGLPLAIIELYREFTKRITDDLEDE